MTCLTRVPIDIARATVPAWHVEEVHLLNPFQRKMARMQRMFQERMNEKVAHYAEAH